MFYTTHPEARQAFTRSLRELADYIDGHRAIPVPAYGATILLHADAAEDGGRAQVDYLARLLDAQVCDETATGGHYSAARAFGVIGYEITSIPGPVMATHRALQSYRGSVTPDPVPDTWT
jgi:hypothetical protein